MIVEPSEALLNNLQRYLLTHGWSPEDHPNQRLKLLRTTPDDTGAYASVAIPASLEFRDAGELVSDAIRSIASHENTSAEQVLDRLLLWDRDVLRARFLKLLGYEDSLPLGIAADAISGLKEFIGYAAYTHTDPRPFFDKTGAISSEFARHCRFGHTFKGSFGLTVECPLSVTPFLRMEGNEPDVPLERQVFERVANGLQTLREAVERESLDPLLSGYRSGFNANMCRSLAEIYENADGRRIEYDVTWSPELPARIEHHWNPVLFEGRAYEITRAAAAELETSETFPDSLIEGRILMLKSETPPGLDDQFEFEHVITMFWERERGQTVRIRIPLSPGEYIQACDAHKDGRSIRVYGVPEKAGKFWTLTRAHGFAVL